MLTEHCDRVFVGKPPHGAETWKRDHLVILPLDRDGSPSATLNKSVPIGMQTDHRLIPLPIAEKGFNKTLRWLADVAESSL